MEHNDAEENARIQAAVHEVQGNIGIRHVEVVSRLPRHILATLCYAILNSDRAGLDQLRRIAEMFLPGLDERTIYNAVRANDGFEKYLGIGVNAHYRFRTQADMLVFLEQLNGYLQTNFAIVLNQAGR